VSVAIQVIGLKREFFVYPRLAHPSFSELCFILGLSQKRNATTHEYNNLKASHVSGFFYIFLVKTGKSKEQVIT
jgi:hypothetical protein